MVGNFSLRPEMDRSVRKVPTIPKMAFPLFAKLDSLPTRLPIGKPIPPIAKLKSATTKRWSHRGLELLWTLPDHAHQRPHQMDL